MADLRGTTWLAVPAIPLAAMTALLFLFAGSTGHHTTPPTPAICGPGGTGHTIAGVEVDAEQLGNAHTIVAVTAGRRLPVYAAAVAVATSYTEVKLRNQLAQTDHDSEGLFQQRISIYAKPVADNPVKATNAFLDRLVQVPGWRTNPVGVNAQAVQRSAYPDRYEPHAGLAEQIVAQYWPSAAATARTHPRGRPAYPAGVPVCPGGGAQSTTEAASREATGRIVGPTGNTIAGTTQIPRGLVIHGSAKGIRAVRYALRQLGKPYVWGAAGPDAFDCSGLTMAAWAAAGIALPHLSTAQTGYGTPSPTDLSQAVAGDLVMIPGALGTPAQPRHVGIVAGYVDRPDGRHLYLIQAPSAGVPVELTEATRWSGQITDVRHIA